ncbi:MAG: PTS-dependent dihydroxyacetone kinase phosphotransferase subunit DhaM [Lachnospiraceae bacterium]|nr:PTS-dependent dihydroxyacetone kinase phosphotransferase subunit DhaM [Lachnospiraceae bacterium]
MVGIVIVSHSEKLAQSVIELSALMAPETPMAAAGGMEDGGFGTSYEKITNAIDSVYSEDGVIVLMDLGSAVMTTEMVIEDMAMMDKTNIKMVDCPIVEGAISASVVAAGGAPIEDVIESAKMASTMNKF